MEEGEVQTYDFFYFLFHTRKRQIKVDIINSEHPPTPARCHSEQKERRIERRKKKEKVSTDPGIRESIDIFVSVYQ